MTAVQAGLKLLKRRWLIRSEADSPTAKPTIFVLNPWRRARSKRSSSVPLKYRSAASSGHRYPTAQRCMSRAK